MIKQYIVNGKQYQYEEGEQPEDAVELKAVEPEKKIAKAPANKSRKPAKTKGGAAK